jgi:7 transmembrane sweet-taste receptor of 3 GCPR
LPCHVSIIALTFRVDVTRPILEIRLWSLGHIITYAALFTKLWRVNKVLQFSRRKVEVKHVAGPMLALVLAALLILSLWTALDPLEWTRVEINEDTGESFGRCSQEHLKVFVPLLMIVVLIPTLLTLYMAWKTKDVDEAYSESKWIFALIILQLQIILFAVPIIALIRDVSTDGRYLGLVVIFWTFPMSTLALIILPKVRAHWVAVHRPQPQKSKRGESVGVKISGLAGSQAPLRPSESTPQSESQNEQYGIDKSSVNDHKLSQDLPVANSRVALESVEEATSEQKAEEATEEQKVEEATTEHKVEEATAEQKE